MIQDNFLGPKLGPRPQRILFFLHGYGADGKNFQDLAFLWGNYLTDAVFFFPDAPYVCGVYAGGFQWFSLPHLPCFDLHHIQSELDQITPLLERYIREKLYHYNLGEKDCAVMGFSQGAMLALNLLTCFENLGGILAYSGAFVSKDASCLSLETPVLLVHGKQDHVVPFELFMNSKEQLKKKGVRNLKAQTYEGLDHTIDSRGVEDGLRFLNKIWKGKEVFG